MRQYFVCWMLERTGVCGVDHEFVTDTHEKAQDYADSLMDADDDYICWVVSKPVTKKIDVYYQLDAPVEFISVTCEITR